jgi:hypothetical protein
LVGLGWYTSLLIHFFFVHDRLGKGKVSFKKSLEGSGGTGPGPGAGNHGRFLGLDLFLCGYESMDGCKRCIGLGVGYQASIFRSLDHGSCVLSSPHRA